MAPFVVRHRPRQFDTDATGALWAGGLFVACHDAWEALLAHVGLPISHILRKEDWGLPLAHVEAKARTEVPEVAVEGDLTVELVALSERSLRVRYRVGEGWEAESVHVCIDRKTGRPRPLPEALRQALEPFLTR